MNKNKYPLEELGESYDDGTMPASLASLQEAVIGRRIVEIRKPTEQEKISYSCYHYPELVLVLDNGTKATIKTLGDCCAFTTIESFFVNPELVDHMIMGVGTTDGYTRWHIYADLGDIMQLEVGWSAGNTGYYGYGFDIVVEPML